MSRELKPCPFCGGEAQHNDGGNSVYGRFWWAVWCEECGIEVRDREAWSHEADRTVLKYPAQECFDRWNRRALAAPSIDAEAAELLRRLITWDIDFPPNCWNGYAGLKELNKIIADAKKATGFDGFEDRALAPNNGETK